jgi:hypothetical protein
MGTPVYTNRALCAETRGVATAHVRAIPPMSRSFFICSVCSLFALSYLKEVLPDETQNQRLRKPGRSFTRVTAEFALSPGR